MVLFCTSASSQGKRLVSHDCCDRVNVVVLIYVKLDLYPHRQIIHSVTHAPVREFAVSKPKFVF